MGEIAEMMLNGHLCEGCGVAPAEGETVALGRPDGPQVSYLREDNYNIPIYCSSCIKYYGGDDDETE